MNSFNLDLTDPKHRRWYKREIQRMRMAGNNYDRIRLVLGLQPWEMEELSEEIDNEQGQ